MLISLPDLSQSSCRSFGVCGSLKDSEKAGIKWIKKIEGRFVTRTRVNRQTAFINAVFGQAHFDGHCHLEVATRAYFRKTPKKDTATWEEIQEKFDPLSGKQFSAHIVGEYVLPVDRLPTIIKMTREFDVVQDGVSIKMNGGRLKVTGTPIYAISWGLFKESEKEIAAIQLEARAGIEINENYMVRAFELLHGGFVSFIESGVPSGPE